MIVVVLEVVPVVVDRFHVLVPVPKVNHHEAVPLVRCIKRHRSAEVVARDEVLVVAVAAATAEINHFAVSLTHCLHRFPYFIKDCTDDCFFVQFR